MIFTRFVWEEIPVSNKINKKKLMYQFLNHEKKEFVMSKQILRSGTSIGANIAEAIYGSSKKDFVAKLQIANKEAAETLYWLELLAGCDYIPDALYTSLHEDCHELLRMLTSAIKTSTE